MKFTKKIYGVICVYALCAFFLISGCAISKSPGMYIGEGCPGWYNARPAGTGPVQAYTAKNLNSYESFANIYFTTNKEGELAIRIYCGKATPQFTANAISVEYRDKGLKQVMEAQSELTLEVGGSRDFIVIIPAFKVNDVFVPELKARFRWSDKPVYLFRGP